MKKDNKTAITIFIGGAIIALLIYMRKKQLAASAAIQQATATPDEIAVNSQPIGPLTIDATIANQGLNFLQSNYIPLFGFVGMAQGSIYQ